MLLIQFPIKHHTYNYDRVSLTSINFERDNGILNSSGKKKYETYLCVYDYKIRLRFLNGTVTENIIFVMNSLCRIPSQLIIDKKFSLGSDKTRIEISMDFQSWNDTKYYIPDYRTF
jgi:hypothetical protein